MLETRKKLLLKIEHLRGRNESKTKLFFAGSISSDNEVTAGNYFNLHSRILPVPMQTLNASQEPRPGRTLKLVEASKGKLPILLVVARTHAIKQGSPGSYLAQAGVAAFGIGV